MRSLSIRFRITFWFTVALVIVALFTCFVVLSVSNRIIQKTIRDNLIETVENNVDEIEFYKTMDNGNDVDHYVAYKTGYLEIDDDFLDEVNQVYTALYSSDGSLLYGENPIAKDVSGLKLTDSKIREIKADGTVYYIFDRKLTAEGLEGLWLRGIVSEEQGTEQITSITGLSLILLPVLVLIASIGGYLLTRRMLRPIQKISETAQQIGKENDLKKRIDIGTGDDELHQLTKSFNDMFEKLEEAFEAERQFTSDASHELRTPMSVITSQCEFILEMPRSAEEYEDALRVIQRQSRKMTGLINDMLDFTRLENGTDRYSREEVDMSELVSSVCSDMALIKENGISLEFDVESGVHFNGNRELLSRLLMNLISNAYRYGKENGHILVRLITGEKTIELSVADDGIGVAREEQEKIFRRFYQSDYSRSGVGMGLGLSMAYEIAKFHGGRIQVESELGKGSTFVLCLPCK